MLFFTPVRPSSSAHGPHRRHRRSALLLLLAPMLVSAASAAVGCSGGSSSSAADAGTGMDASTGTDASTADDTGAPTDSSTTPDAAGSEASPAADSGSTDAASISDAGSEAGSTPDGGNDAGDAGVATDAASTDAAVADAADAGCTHTLYVSSSAGLDTQPGTQALPFKTITHALASAPADGCFTTVQVAAGTYDVANGEVFPLAPANIAVIGDEANKGAATGATVSVIGGGAAGPDNATFAPGPGAIVAGLLITSPANAANDAGPMFYGAAIGWLAAGKGVTIRNDTLSGSIEFGVDLNGGTGQLVGNVITGNGGSGIDVNSGSVMVQGNTITGNPLGIATGPSNLDLGGGALGSTGGNVLSCNKSSDVFNEGSGTLFARNDAWDHVSPTTGTTGGFDIDNRATQPVDTTGATLAPHPCP